ncbi:MULTISPECIES: FAD-dependent monooxygenase [Streptomyces]|uniref:FAD-dependent monooxygenase n=1 Tax=Streptomyces TaxID=1883 RepID=UPI0015FE42A5|nr:FAD-dependent monooxygenase [Streptomyces sp. GMR22]MBA6433889.1 FAD-dependent monooxygenase [Streptomyces sp. GMR22]MBI0375157.1 FAD-dependent monooxygenase [Streptomyces albiflaviniger]
MEERTAVLVVGGSLVGLSAAVFLAHQGVPCVVAERHVGTSIHPRARGITARSMELFRQVGLEDAVRAHGQDDIGVFVRARALADDDHHAVVMPQTRTPDEVSPTTLYACDQDRLEPLLLARARELGADVRFGTELVDFTQSRDEVSAVLRDRGSGERRTVRARYLVAADGGRSPVRERLGISRSGPGTLQHQVSILFRADLDRALRGREVFACFLETMSGVLVRRDADVWQMGVPFTPERGESADDFTDERCREVVRTGTGLADLDAEIDSVLSWEIAALVADRFREGRIFLAGDSAHVSSPRGGLGGNGGIQDAHNLAWKLAAVLAGHAGERLLDTYETERRPIAFLNMEYALGRMRGEPWTQEYNTVSLGYRYHSPAFAAEEGADGPGGNEKLEDPTAPSGRPGTRAAHVPLPAGYADGASSTLDLFGREFVLLTGDCDAEWRTAAKQAADGRGIPLAVHAAGAGDASAEGAARAERWRVAYGLPAEGAVLVRPDGYIVWRGRRCGDDAAERLGAALDAACGRGREPVSDPG